MKSKLWLVPIIAVGLTFLLTACYKPVTKGLVIAKDHDPARSWVQPVPVMIGKVLIVINVWHFDDEDWIVTLQDEDLSGTVYIKESQWNEIEIGDHVDFGVSAETFDNVERTRQVLVGDTIFDAVWVMICGVLLIPAFWGTYLIVQKQLRDRANK